MPVYLISATDENGKRDTHRVEAESAQEACETFEASGCIDIVLHSDDAYAATTDLFPANPEVDENLSAADLVELQYLNNFQQFLFMLRRTYWQSRWFYLLVGAVLVYGLYNDSDRFIDGDLNPIEIGILVAFLLPPFFCLWNVYFSPAQKYKQLMHAFSWGLWDDVISQAPGLRGKVPGFELAGRHAVALAAQGRFDEGLKLLKPFEDNPDVPRWMYLGRLSEMYEILKEKDQVIECLRLAYEDAPENPTVQLDYAYSLLKYQENLPLAQQLITEAEQQHLSELLQHLLPYFKGVLALNLDQLREAEAYFRDCDSRLKPLAPSEPMLQLFADLNRAYLAITLASLGESEQAHQLYRKVEPRLIALDSTLLIDRYQQSIR